jgi:uncharacterized protein (TIRG00374 family)
LKPSRLKKTLITFVKFGLSAALIGYLVIDASRGETFTNLVEQPKHWGLLAAAWALCMAAVLTTIVRWYFLVRALDLPFTMRDALRLGFLGYLFNFVSLGTVGGDLFKAVFLAREHRGQRTAAVATVLADRLVGLYALFLVAAGAILATGQWNAANEVVRDICRTTLAVAAGSTVGFILLLLPGVKSDRLRAKLNQLPRVGALLEKIFTAIDMYRLKPGALIASVAISFVTHGCSGVGFYLIAVGLPGAVPSLAEQFLIVPLAMVTGILPLPLNGLGAVEAALDYLYQAVPVGIKMQQGQGFVIAIVYRLITIGIAMVGAIFYLGHRREVDSVLKTAEAEQDADDDGELQASSAVPA